jgi:hypothetical protein
VGCGLSKAITRPEVLVSHRNARTTFHGRVLIVERFAYGWSKARLLEIVHDFMVFDAGVKETCRHNQYFGVKAARPQVQRARSRTALRQAAHAGDVTSMSE